MSRLKTPLSAVIAKKMKNYPVFHQKVWKACSEIPAGQVKTYGWIAKKIGVPGGARAVGTALAANPFAPTIPCHRVIRSDGGMGGYSGNGGGKSQNPASQKGRGPFITFPLK